MLALFLKKFQRKIAIIFLPLVESLRSSAGSHDSRHAGRGNEITVKYNLPDRLIRIVHPVN